MVMYFQHNLFTICWHKKSVQFQQKFDDVLKQVKYAIDDFAKKTSFISKNYTDYKNQSLKGIKIKYSFEESALTMLAAFNIGEEFKQYLLDLLLNIENQE